MTRAALQMSYMNSGPIRIKSVTTQCLCIPLLRRSRGVVGRGRGGDGVPHFFRQGGTRPPLPHFFGLKFVQKLVHCCNWLLTETQRKIISVQQN